MSATLEKRAVIVLGGDDRARPLVAGLTACGADTLTITDAALATQEIAMPACAAAGATAGSFDLVVVPVGFAGVDAPGSLESMDEDRWRTLAEDPLQRVRTALQVASTLLRAPGGVLVLVLADFGMGGVAGFTAQSMAAEGARALGKSVARAWLSRGLRVNSLALSAAQIRGARDAKPRPSLDAVARLILLMADADACITGNTVIADGGERVSV